MGRQTVIERIASQAQQLYDREFKTRYEPAHAGQFLAIDIMSGTAHLGQRAEEALQAGRQECPYGVFHLIRIGAPGAFSSQHARTKQSARYW